MTVDASKSLTGRPFFCSWSGGKDSCLALYHAIQKGGNPHSLLIILSEDGVTSRSHALPKPLIVKQARSLGLQPAFRSASWEQYVEEFIALGFITQIVVINEQKLDKHFLGKVIQPHTVSEMEEAGIDPSGELREYHTVVTNGPIFSWRFEIKTAEQEYHDGCWFLKTYVLEDARSEYA
jgi:diphthine-ammonia ligase